MAEQVRATNDEDIPMNEEVSRNENRTQEPADFNPNSGPIGIEISAVANLIACGYSGHVERTFNNIVGKDVVVSFDIPK